MPRCFIAIDLSEEIKRKLSSFIEELKPLKEGIKWVRPESLHITLKFLGEVREEKIEKIKKVLEGIASSYKPFTIRIKGTGQFPDNRKPRVLWTGIEDSETLIFLQKEIEKSLSKLGFKEEEREFTGHITIARLKSLSGIEELLDRLTKFKEKEFGIQEVKEIVLMKSELKPEGARYERIETFKLKCHTHLRGVNG